MEVEKLDLVNIIEVNRIRELLLPHPDLASMFELIIIMGNNRLNEPERPALGIKKNLSNEDLSESDSDEEIEVKLESDSEDDDNFLSVITETGEAPSH